MPTNDKVRSPGPAIVWYALRRAGIAELRRRVGTAEGDVDDLHDVLDLAVAIAVYVGALTEAGRIEGRRNTAECDINRPNHILNGAPDTVALRTGVAGALAYHGNDDLP
jgi:hypothetical protein